MPRVLLRLTEQIEERRKHRNEIENDARIQITLKDYETEQRALEIARDLEYARIEQHRDIETRKAAQLSQIAEEHSKSSIGIETAKIRAEQEAERIRIARDKLIEAERIASANETRTLAIKQQQSTDTAKLDKDRRVESSRIESMKAIDLLTVDKDKQIRVSNEIALVEQDRIRIMRHYHVQLERLSKDEEIAQAEIAKSEKIKLAETTAMRNIEDTQIAVNRDIEQLQVAARSYNDRFEIEQRKEIEIVDKERLIAVINKSIEEAYAQTKVAEARKLLALSEEQIFSARDEEAAQRAKRIDLISAASRTEREAMRVTSFAKAEMEATEFRAQARIAEAEADEVRFQKDAAGQRLLNESENMRSDASRRSAIYEHLVRALPNIIRETVKPMENIDSIKILQVDGLPGLNSPSEGGGHGANGAATGEGGSMTDSVVNSAMKYRTHVALVDGLMKEMGLPIENLGSAGGMQFRNFLAPGDKGGSGKDD